MTPKVFTDKKNLLIVIFILLLLLNSPREGARFAIWVCGGVSIACLTDWLINRLFLKKNIFPNSAIISGFIVSGITDYRQPWFVLIILCGLAIILKHLVKFHNRHIFNPANLALCVATLFRIPLVWNVESNIALIVIFGLYFTYIYKKATHVLGFLVSFLAPFAFLRTNAFGMISWFFVFVMLIEPKTSGSGMKRGFIFGLICGASCFLAFRFLNRYDPFVLSLFVANLANPVLEKINK